MKRFSAWYLLLFLPLMFGISCSGDDDTDETGNGELPFLDQVYWYDNSGSTGIPGYDAECYWTFRSSTRHVRFESNGRLQNLLVQDLIHACGEKYGGSEIWYDYVTYCKKLDYSLADAAVNNLYAITVKNENYNIGTASVASTPQLYGVGCFDGSDNEVIDCSQYGNEGPPQIILTSWDGSSAIESGVGFDELTTSFDWNSYQCEEEMFDVTDIEQYYPELGTGEPYYW